MASVARARQFGERGLHAVATRDRELLREFLEQDRLYAAYALCDLDDREFGKTRWGVAWRGHRAIAVALQYTGLSPQPLFVMGEPEGIVSILRDVIKPRLAYLAALPTQLSEIAQVYHVEPGPEMVRMAVDRATFRPYLGAPARLVPSEIRDLNRLYNLGLTSWLPAETISNGVYYGVRSNGLLVAAAGTHVVSHTARLGVVGNVLTHHEYRGRGFAKMVTSAVTGELLRTCDQVVLNVRADNPPALAAYRALGYREHTRFEERLAHRRLGRWDSIVSPLRRLFPTTRSPE